MSRLVIIADDLTGSNDAGLQFAKQGFRTLSLLDAEWNDLNNDADVCVFNAETRSLHSQLAYERTKEIARHLDLNLVPYVYKKIDSTMRGNIGAEIDALMDSLPFDLAVVVPAYPKNDRKTIGGYHLVNQMLLEDSEIARDPKCPVTQSHIPTLLSGQSKRPIGHVELKTIRESGAGLTDRVRDMVAQGNSIIVFDAVFQDDLKAITEAVSTSGLKTLWVGSAGLAHSLSEVIDLKRKARTEQKEPETNSFFPTFVVAGSVNAITRQQIEALNERDEFQVIVANPLSFLEDSERGEELEKITKLLIDVIDNGKSPVLTTDVSESTRLPVGEWMRKNGRDGLYAGNQIADCLGKLGAMVVSRRKLGGMVLTGGDIAYRTCKYLQVKAFWILDEVEEGIPFSQVIGGSADALPIITKAGAFGNRFSLVHAVEKIKTYRGSIHEKSF
ncbi:four-carbon acid sugar kinase family protein [Effusibacillus consociatus]|uniref:four-carbon acid sugar kinase family protein n=1 Tax=Effusibacillus consociatus TaxID=1117041 RepID=UPI0036D32511